MLIYSSQSIPLKEEIESLKSCKSFYSCQKCGSKDVILTTQRPPKPREKMSLLEKILKNLLDNSEKQKNIYHFRRCNNTLYAVCNQCGHIKDLSYGIL